MDFVGVFASARQQEARFKAAAWPLRLALEVARRAGLREDRAELLNRTSNLLSVFGHPERALAVSTEALMILGSETG